MNSSLIHTQINLAVSSTSTIPVDEAKQDEDSNEVEKDKFEGKEKPDLQKEGFNIFKAAWGIVKGFTKEIFTMLGFFLKSFIHPIETIKGLINGGVALVKLISNPTALASALKNGWERFKSMDSDERGQFIGRLLFNFTPVSGLLNPLLINARLASSLIIRPAVSLKAITQNVETLARFYRASGNDLKKTLLAARKIGRRANLEKDFQRLKSIQKVFSGTHYKLILENVR